jgi:hypothetical protein
MEYGLITLVNMDNSTTTKQSKLTTKTQTTTTAKKMITTRKSTKTTSVKKTSCTDSNYLCPLYPYLKLCTAVTSCRKSCKICKMNN